MIFKGFMLLVCVLLTVSCGLPGGEIPADHYYRLPDAQAEKLSTPVVENLLFNPVRVEGLYHERSILYVEQSAPLEIKRYHYHYWVETPAKLVQKYIHSYLYQSNISRHILANVSDVRPDIETDMTITQFERIVDQGNDQIVVNLKVSVKNNKDSNKGFTKDYTSKVEVGAGTMYATVEGFGVALNDIMTNFINDLNKKL